MAVLVVIPVDEHTAVSAGVLDVIEPGRERGPVLHILNAASE
jgi:hypothetical protein